MDRFFKYVNLNRDQTITLGIILTAIGLTLGLSYDTGIFYQIIISRVLLLAITPLGLFLLLYGYYIKFYMNPTILFIKSIAFIIVMYTIFFLSLYIQNEYFQDIVIFVFLSGLGIMKKEKLNKFLKHNSKKN